MFDWFKRPNYSNVVKFPEQVKAPNPYIEPPKAEKTPITYYKLGLTDNNRVSFQMGYSEITMNANGIDTMIRLLETYRDQLHNEGNDDDE